MTKVSEARSALRRALLVKSADDYSRMLQSYAGSQGAATRGGVQHAVNANLAASGYGKPKAAPAKVVPSQRQAAPAPQAQSEYQWSHEPLYKSVSVQAPKDYQGSCVIDALDTASRWPEYAKKAWGRFTGSLRPSVKPVIGTAATAR